MKSNSRFIKSALAGVLFLSGISCNSLLDIDADGNISGDIYATEAGIQNALVGAYYNLGGIYDGVEGGELLGGDFILISTLLSVQSIFEMDWDDANGPAYSNFVNRNILATNSRVEANWRRAYETLNTLNSILANIDNVTTTSEKNRIQGEALAMRGILYFEMVRLWGQEYDAATASTDFAIPLLLDPVDEPGRSPDLNTVEEIYTQVEADLTTASGLLQSLGKNGTNISYYACQAYLMRLAMHKDEFDDAIAFADIIIPEFSLTATPQDAFNNTSNSTEDIFAIQQNGANNTGDISTGTGLTNYYSSLNGKGLGAMRVQKLFLTNPFGDFDNSPEYDTLVDLRGSIDNLANSDYTVESVTTGFYTNILNTFVLSPAKYMSSDRVIPIVRLSEIQLTRAEARAFQSQNLPPDVTALNDYNAIRTRAGLSALMASDFSLGAILYDSILLERKREFLYEGLLLHDMRRRGESLNGNPAIGAEFLLPIPQSELDATQ